MFGSIRNQILIPLFAVQLGTVATIALVAARGAADRIEAQVASRLEGVVETLGRSSFPLTGSVLAKMRALSGAHFATSDDSRRIIESTLPGLGRLPDETKGRALGPRLGGVGAGAELVVEGDRYFAWSVRPGGGPRLLVLYPEAAWRRARWEASLPPIGVGALSLAPMAVVTGFVAHRLGVRLRSVEARVAAIAAGDFREIQETSGRQDEVETVVGSVNRMAGELRRMREAIRRAERSGVLAQLAAGLAHQLRNAATGARMAVQLHARRCQGPAGDASLDVALRQLALCEQQVQGLLTTERIEPGERTRFEASEILAEVASLVQPLSDHRRIDLNVSVEKTLILHLDREALRSALLNLAQNAIEATGPGGRVELVAARDGSLARFDVLDDGPGPPPEIAPTIFEPFVTGKPEGIGLGLVVARRVAEGLNGSLTWSRVNDRTRFRLEFLIGSPTEGGSP